jgi:restriction system protein
MARRARHAGPWQLQAADAFLPIWFLVAAWALMPWFTQLIAWFVTRSPRPPLPGLSFASFTPGALPYLVGATLLLVGLWVLAIRVALLRQAAGKRLDELLALTPAEFEAWVGARFRDQGYMVRRTGATGDHGMDLLATRGTERVVIQCKRYQGSVGEPVEPPAEDTLLTRRV